MMILADTSVWIDHLRRGDERLSAALDADQVLTHPFVIGELACGNLRKRTELLDMLSRLPATQTATDDEVLTFIERKRLIGRGIGIVDAHLLASVALSTPARLWTRDRQLKAAATELKLAYE